MQHFRVRSRADRRSCGLLELILTLDGKEYKQPVLGSGKSGTLRGPVEHRMSTPKGTPRVLPGYSQGVSEGTPVAGFARGTTAKGLTRACGSSQYGSSPSVVYWQYSPARSHRLLSVLLHSWIRWILAGASLQHALNTR